MIDATATEVKTCECGTAVDDLPLFFRTRTYRDADGNDIAEEDHMFNGCPACGESFCSCGRPHKVKAA